MAASHPENTTRQLRRGALLLALAPLLGWATSNFSAGKAEPPTLVHQVDPVYPDKALKNKLEGNVRVNLTINGEGAVIAAKVVRSDNPVFNAAALAAVKQWKYKKAKAAKGAPAAPVHHVVTVSFKPPHPVAEPEEPVEPPELLYHVDPIYPVEARRNKLEGLVILKVSIGENGAVLGSTVIRSDNVLFVNPAQVAVGKWKYKITDAQRKRGQFPVFRTVTIRFAL
jgi:TonB family protein